MKEDPFLPDGFRQLSSFYKDDEYEIIKAERVADKKLVIFKTSRPAGEDIFKISKLSHEYDIVKDLNHDGLIKINKIHSKNKLIFIEEEYFEGNTLKEILQAGPISIGEFLNYSFQLIDVLIYLHQMGIIHKDINSNNILISESGKLKLINFGISSNIINEEHEIVPPDKIEGNLAYLSPEQTGRTSYAITQSSDLYSLGIVFYEMLTGNLPFYSKDPLEMIHYHLSKVPDALNNSNYEIPSCIHLVLSDLLEKIPDNRYQSALGLKNDLELIELSISQGTNTDDFKTKTTDKAGKFRKTQRLYGRDKEIKDLINAYDQLKFSRSMLVLVSGYSGVGKSAVVKQLQRPVIEKRSLFLSGKFDQFKRNIPYFAFIEAFDELIKNILSQTDDNITYWKEKILNTLKLNASLMIEVIPGLEHIIGSCPPTIKLAPAEQEYRFRQVLLDFILCFSSVDSPLVLFLDDLQWSDLPSLNLLERILDHPENLQVLIVGAYRDNEVNEAHPLSITIGNIQKVGVQIRNISLQPLDAFNTRQIVADSFGMTLKQAEKLSLYVYSKTKGNPFFLNRFLQSLFENKFIFLDVSGDWQWDQAKIESLDYTENVIDLMSKELGSLPENTKIILSKASVLGNTFNIDTLSYLTQINSAILYQYLTAALRGGYILHSNQNYRSFSLYQPQYNAAFDYQTNSTQSNFKFLHDRVHQAAYGMNTLDQRKEIHLQAARTILANTPKDKLNDVLFDISSHYVEGLNLVTSEDEKLTITNLFFQAGTKSKESTSYDVAVKYFGLAKSLLKPDHWISQYDLSFKIYSELSQSEYLNNNHEAEEELFEQIIVHAKTKLEKFKTYYIHSSLYLKIGNTAKSLQIGREALKLYDITFPESPEEIKEAAIKELTKYLTLFSTEYQDVDKLSRIPENEDPEIEAIYYLFIDFASSAYQENADLTALIILRILEFFIKNGFNGGANWGILGFATLTYSVLGMSELGFKLMDLDTKLRERTISPFIKTKQDYSNNAFSSHWRRPLRETADELIPLFRRCLAHGNPIFGAYCIAINFWKKSSSGLPLNDVLSDTKDLLLFLERTRNGTGLDYSIPRVNMVLTLCGKTPNIGDWNDSKFNEEDFLIHLTKVGGQTSIAFYYTAKLPLYYFFGNFKEGIDWISKGEVYQPYLMGLHCISEWRFYSSMIIYSYNGIPSDEQKEKFIQIRAENLKWYTLWASGCQVNFEQQFYILSAEEKRLEGNALEAILLYEQAIKTSEQNSYPQFNAIANERMNILMRETGISSQADTYLVAAFNQYKIWGAAGVCHDITSKRPDLFSSRAHGSEIVAPMNLSNDALDYGSLIKATHSLASTIKLDELIKRLMNVIMENAGADRGVLLIPKDDILFIIAEGDLKTIKTDLSIPLSEYDEKISVPLVNYCWRTREMKSFANIFKESGFAQDIYIQKNNIKSLICIPLTNKGNGVGIIYLENKLLEGVFTSHNLEVLNILVGQIGISIDNALLYENLEAKVKSRTLDLQMQKQLAETERKKSDELLLNILPDEVANELKTNGKSEAKLFENVTVVFTDFVNFSTISEKLTPNQLVFELNKCFIAFDKIIDAHGLEKIKTIGDAYLAVSGLPTQYVDHAFKACQAATEILKWVKNSDNNCLFDIRIGINSGPVIAGIVGLKKYAYDIWGDTVNTASRIEASSIPGKINLSESTYELIKDHFNTVHRGKIEAKNKGSINMYFLEI